jgi:hypothetical protein
MKKRAGISYSASSYCIIFGVGMFLRIMCIPSLTEFITYCASFLHQDVHVTWQNYKGLDETLEHR